jgi:hypothetical protein
MSSIKMARNLPEDADLFLLVTVVLLFLMINYNMPLANIYGFMAIITLIGYLIPVQFNLFRWLPLIKKDSQGLLMKVAVGAAFGFGFIQLYNNFSDTPMAAVFATTVFGSSEILTKLVYSFLIPFVESIFFFSIILVWWAWKIGDNVNIIHPLSFDGIKLAVMFAAVFVLFHATSKGVENTTELVLTFAFGAISVGMILYFKEIIQAIVMHAVVNAKAMSFLPSVAALTSSTIVMVGVGALVAYLFLIKPSSTSRTLI